MDKSLVKRAYSEAEDSLKEKQVEEVKRIVLKTLEKIDSLKKDKDKAQDSVKDIEEKIKLLKMDLDDIKEGRLDRLAERQEKDDRAKHVSVVIIIKEREVVHEVSPWYWPWRVVWPEPIYPPAPVYIGTGINTVTYGGATDGNSTTMTDCVNYSPTISCSSAKWGASGTYELSGGVVNFR